MSNAVRQTEKAVIVSCIDTSKYLVGIEAGKGTITYQRSPEGELMFYGCLNLAKASLVEQGFEVATLVMDSPYDEMIGEEGHESASHEIPLV
ncbi:DUF6482 family protein [Enterovibrio baiacu]|uniref:DUF6482 family protein n=1 Tax=Enterovibrio baiacu TaxID=2491023 RepID=UPI003D0F324C